MHIAQTAAFIANMAQQRIHRYAGGANTWVHLHHDGHHLSLEHLLGHLITVSELKAPKRNVRQPDMCTFIFSFATHNCSILIHMLKNRMCNNDFIPDLLTDEGPSTG
jgi:hypothetical protein